MAMSRPTPTVHLIYDRKGRLPLKLRAFVDFAVPRLRAGLEVAALQLLADFPSPGRRQGVTATPAAASSTSRGPAMRP